MKKMRILIVLTVIAVMVLTACTNQNAVETEDLITTKPASSLAGNTEKLTVSESSTAAEESTTEKIESTTQKSTEPSTTEKATTTTKPTTTTKQSTTAKPTTTKASTTTTKRVTTTKKQTTTSKPTTTKKHTTTQKQTTTEEEWNCAVDGHSCKEGQIGWVNTYDEAQSKALRYIENNGISGNFRVKQCFWCGKYTATVTVR